MNRLVSVTDPYGATTGYTFDAAGNLIGQTDPSGFTTSITPNAANLPETTVHRDASNTVVATTTNTYTSANELESWTTTDPVYNLTLNTDLHYNGNGYIDQANVSHTSANNSPSLTSSLTYKDNNLLDVWTQQGQADTHLFYDGAGRLTCSEYGGNVREFLEYDGSGRREHRTWNFYGYSTCAGVVADPTGTLATSWFYKRSTYTWDGHRLVSEDAANCQNIGLPETSCPPGSLYTRTLSYDADGNVEHVTLTWGGNTTTIDYGWEPGTHHLKSVTKNGSVIATFEYDRLDRIRKFCQSGCQLFSYVGDSDWLSKVVVEENGVVIQRYLYANGRPLRVDIPYVWWVNPWYYRYNARGDYAGFVDKEGGGGTGWTTFGAWGDVQYGSTGYYSWNAAWGYLTFPNSLWAAPGDVLDGIYYAHGRWYVADTGLWLSPNEKGEYVIAATPDPINKGWVPLLTPQLQQQQELPNHGYIHTTNWGFFDINHIRGGHEHAEQILKYFDNLADTQPLRLQTGPIGISQFTEELVVRYHVNRPIPDQLKPAVALSIFLDYENRWERLQERSIPHQMGSGYSIEDLPSDYLGFYSAVSEHTVPVILEEILKEKGKYTMRDDKPIWADSKWAPKNKDIDPWNCEVDIFRSLMLNRLVLSCKEVPWPTEMQIMPVDHPEKYWQFLDCTGTRRIDAGPLRGAYTLGCE